MKRLLALALVVGCASPPAEPPPEQTAGTVRMAQRLQAIREGQPLDLNVFRSGERAERLLALSTPSQPARSRPHRVRLARELLWAGRTDEALEILDALVEAVELEGREEAALDLRKLLALAYLRLGEQQNCIDQHSAASCLLPITQEGRHRVEAGSRSALRELRRVLQARPDDLESRWLLNVAAMTVGDYPGGIPAELLVPPSAFASEAPLARFRDTAPMRGLAVIGLAGGSVVEDLDGDGRVDVMVSSWGLEDPLKVLVNDGRGGFEDRSAQAGLDGITGGLNLVPADYDNDGDVDVLVLRGAWLGPHGNYPESLLRNDGNARFDDVTEQAGLLRFAPTQTAAWGDYDGDGHLDLFVGTEAAGANRRPCELYRNNGNGTFEEVGAQEGTAVVGFVKGSSWGDYDNDGLLDLYVSRLDGPNTLLRNRGPRARPRFEDVTSEAGVAKPDASFPTWFFDYDNDGWLDLFVAGYPSDYVSASPVAVIADYLGRGAETSVPRLYRNRADGTFEDVTAEAGLERVLFAMGANFGDLDNDGWLDFYLGTGAPSLSALTPNRMFRNDRGARFQDVTTAGGFGHLQKGHGVSFVDIDHDGDQDVFSVIGGAFSGDTYANVLFENPGNGSSWLTLRLRGTTANRSAIGARLKLVVATPTGRREIHRTVGTGGSFGANSLQAEIGLGDATVVERLEVSWPGAARPELFRGLAINQRLEIAQGEPLPVRIDG